MSTPPAPPPSILYHYYGPQRIDALETLTIRFNRPAKFNDTFDSEFRSAVPDPRARALHLTRLGIFCLTENPDNHLISTYHSKRD